MNDYDGRCGGGGDGDGGDKVRMAAVVTVIMGCSSGSGVLDFFLIKSR